MTRESDIERHQVFREKLYIKASLPKLEFKAAIEVFKDQNPDLISDERFDPGINSFRNFLRNKW